MAALGTTDITTTLVGNTISSSSHSLSVLCAHANINKWSRYKPTRGATGDNTFWKGSDDNCGFILPTLTGNSGNYGVYSNSGVWGYSQPNGTYPYRLGDFRGYDHDSTLKPPFYSDPADNIYHSELTPAQQDIPA